MASGGYPGHYEKGKAITGLDRFEGDSTVIAFHAGTKKGLGDSLISSGGRVLGITALGPDIKSAIDNAYSAVKKVDLEGGFFRLDIGARALSRR